MEVEWDWQAGGPPVRSLIPARRPAADAMSRHAPVHMSCQTTGTYIVLESGLEYELARELDRDPDVVWIGTQPALLVFADGSRHVPDLLSEHSDGCVTVWDARPMERRDEDFVRITGLTAAACAQVGWHYALYDAAVTARRLNLLWLATYRHRPEWPHTAAVARLLAHVAPTATVDDLLALDEGDGHLIAVMWHLLWSGELVVNLDEPIRPGTVVSRR
ncbi:TnsA-like heteromeric transposase endonuclease subunit [Cellulosimicrobium cellulans]|uniref:TnsA-like heteromeric transposase endonuclease subunit n=1 Tax=Cellulosimicrobium composti TaxID=2672572 RepID=A0ABX0BGU9_9MICO|nr:TnsA-like heteromeric transposase endonuclease subunit [Cellulosimicrobium composti]